MIRGLGVYGNNLSFENYPCYTQVLSTFLTKGLGVLKEIMCFLVAVFL